MDTVIRRVSNCASKWYVAILIRFCLFSIITLLNWYFNLNNLEIELLRYMTTIRWMSVRQGFFIDSVLRCSRSTWMSPIFHKIGDACCKWSIRFTNTWYNTTSLNNGDFNYGGMIYMNRAFVQTVNNVILPPTSHLFLLDTRYIVSISLVQWEQQLLFIVSSWNNENNNTNSNY